ncbi:MAG: aminoglycoside phosphotransferase family protein [Clostridia bacterium]|nr:aminoglycoside phosphotransferase family protein [Clostridia bacterium]
MERVENFSIFVEQQLVKVIGLGQSGAQVCEIGGNRIAKLIQRQKLTEEGLWKKYSHEAEFYRSVQGMELPFVPKMLYADVQESEMLLVMEKYNTIDRSEISDALLDKVTAVLAGIHTLPVPGFIKQHEQKPLEYVQADCAAYVSGWESVLQEHGNAFDRSALHEMARDMNPINRRFYSKRACFTHGDFHFENLLQDGKGNILACDWQGCGCGDPSGDLSFLMSRLLSDGYPLDGEKLVRAYCRHANKMGLDVCPEEVRAQMALSNLNISFMYWHRYLHGAEKERVGDIYGKMLEDYGTLKNML